MEIHTRKLSIIHWLTELNDVSIISKIENIKNKHRSPKQELTPITIDELILRHQQSENDIQNNQLIDQDELSNFFKNRYIA